MGIENSWNNEKPDLGIKNIEIIDEEVEKLKTQQNSYLIFDFVKTKPIELGVVSKEFHKSSDVLKQFSEQELRERFQRCCHKLDRSKPYFIIYDFHYHNKENNYRSILVFISYIPDSLDCIKKVAYASNMNFLIGRYGIPHHIMVDSLDDDMTYDKVVHSCCHMQR